MGRELSGLEVRIAQADVAENLQLCDIAFDIAPNNMTCLLGPSGCGKSSVLRIVAGLRVAEHASVKLNGDDITHVPPHARQVGLLFQQPSLFPHLNVRENVAFGATDEALVELWLERVGMAGRVLSYPHELSGGQAQRVAFARTMAAQPKALLLDEPFASLDYALKSHMRDQLWQWVRDENLPILMVTHDPMEAMQLADEVLVLEQGSIGQAGDVDALYERPASLFVAGLFGEMNVEPESNDGAVRMVRPEHVRIVSAEQKEAMRGTVMRYRRVGEHYRVLVDVQGVTWVAYDHDNLGLDVGSQVYLLPEDDKWVEVVSDAADRDG